MNRNWLLVVSAIVLLQSAAAMSPSQRKLMAEKVKEMFYHGYNNYLAHAFPHDELKPLTATWTDSLMELGNAQKKDGSYRGVAMTLIDSLSTLAVIGNKTEFARAVRWVSEHVSFDVDVRVNVFEANIRLLGGLLSAHALALDKSLGLMDNYNGGLLRLARDLGDRMMAAFRKDFDLPYAWVNLKHGVEPSETREQCTAGVGTLLLEFGLLSHYTGDMKYFEAVDRAMNRLWQMKSHLNLLGNTFDAQTLDWKNTNSGIGAGIDSYYEYLMKAYMLFGNSKYYEWFMQLYQAVTKHLKSGHWYVEANMHTGHHTHLQFNSLQAFWPGLQVLIGDFPQAIPTQEAFFGLWQKYGALPERYLLNSGEIHSSERYYPLRPEFVESTYLLYSATRNPAYLQMGDLIYHSLQNITRVPHGYASVHNVGTGELEDRMTSFFLAETCKYLYLLFDDENFAHRPDYIFTTEGHLFPLDHGMHHKFGDGTKYSNVKNGTSSGSKQPKKGEDKTKWQQYVCPAIEPLTLDKEWRAIIKAKSETLPEQQPQPQCAPPAQGNNNGQLRHGDFTVTVGEGSFNVQHKHGEALDIRNLGTQLIEVVDHFGNRPHAIIFHDNLGVMTYFVNVTDELVGCNEKMSAVGAFFGPHELDELDGVSARKHNGDPENPVVSSGTPANSALRTDSTSGSANSGSGSGSADGSSGPSGTAATVPPTSDSQSQAVSTQQQQQQQQVVLPDSLYTEESFVGELVLAEPVLACEPLRPSKHFKGKVVLVERGKCTFMEKILNVQNAGALAMVLGNGAESNNYFMMGEDGSGRQPTIPSVMVTKPSLDTLRRCLDSHNKLRTANDPRLLERDRQRERRKREQVCAALAAKGTVANADDCVSMQSSNSGYSTAGSGGGSEPLAPSSGLLVQITRRRTPAWPLQRGTDDQEAELKALLSNGKGLLPFVAGTHDHFRLMTLGSHVIEIEKRNAAYILRLP